MTDKSDFVHVMSCSEKLRRIAAGEMLDSSDIEGEDASNERQRDKAQVLNENALGWKCACVGAC